MGKLNGKTAVVTGSTSGIGKAIALLFAQEGASVLITGRDEDRAKKVTETIRQAGGSADYCVADLTQPDAVDLIAEKAAQVLGDVDILVNNAGIVSGQTILELTKEEWQRMIGTNVTASLFLSQTFGTRMKERGCGHIVNISSISGFSAHWGNIAYVVTKHAVVGMTKALAMELGPEVHVNGICPGGIRTPMLDSCGGEEGAGALIERSPLLRIADPEEIASVALFLATGESAFIDGQTIRADGGIDI